jgi:hypothetical protein
MPSILPRLTAAATLLALLLAAPVRAGEPVAYLCTSCGAFDGAKASNDIGGYDTAHPIIGDYMQGGSRNWTRLFIHNPGGIHALGFFPDPADFYAGTSTVAAQNENQETRVMLPNQWQLAKQAQCSWAVDSELNAFHDAMVGTYGVTEIIYYFGSPDMFADPYIEGLRALKPFMELGAASTVSFAFDVMGADELVTYHPGPPDVGEYRRDRCRRLCDVLRHRGHKVYLEPRPNTTVSYWQGYVDGTIAEQTWDAANPTYVTASATLGEQLLITSGEDQEGEAGAARSWQPITPVVRSYSSMASDLFD